MQVYKVQKNQNLYDISVCLFGSIEGIFDLMANNSELSYNTVLKEGDELLWNEKAVIYPNIVDGLRTEHIIPANKERNVYFKETDATLRCCIQIAADNPLITLNLAGDHTMIVDWGDNSPLESIELQPTTQQYMHYFDDVVESRYVRLYGDFNIKTWDASGINGLIMPTTPLIVDEFVSKKNNIPLQGLFLFKGTYSVVLSGMKVESLKPIQDMSLSYLELIKNTYDDPSCVDNYLIYLATHNNQRRNCRIVLDIQPSGTYGEPPKDINGNYVITTGMQAIYVILHEPAWNESGAWVFNINGTEYSADNLRFNYHLSLIME